MSRINFNFPCVGRLYDCVAQTLVRVVPRSLIERFHTPGPTRDLTALAQGSDSSVRPISKLTSSGYPAHVNLANGIITDSALQLRKVYTPEVTPRPSESYPCDGHFAVAKLYEDAFEIVTRALSTNRDEIIDVASDERTRGYFERLLERFNLSGNSTHVLDLFGSGFFAQGSEHVDSISGIRLEAYKSEAISESGSVESLPKEILGDIFNPNTWDSLDQSMEERGIPMMDLITMNPVSGWEGAWSQTEELNIHALKFIIGNVLKRLSTHGHFYFNVYFREFEGDIGEHPQLKELSKLIDSHTSYTLILIKRGHDDHSSNGLAGVLLPKKDLV